jgi:hypothetical protein
MPLSHQELNISGTFLDANSDEAINLWITMFNYRKYHPYLLCCDKDSYLWRPDGTYGYHHGSKIPPKPCGNKARKRMDKGLFV